MDIEEAFKQVGEIGVYQRRVFWSTAIPQIFVAWFHLLNIYAGAIPDFYCYLEKPTQENEIKLLNKCSPDPVGNPCISYSFSDVEFTSIASEWDLVCDSAYKCDLVQSIFMIGLLIGNLLGGYTADKYGRKPACCIGSFGFLIFGLLSTFATSYNQYLSLRLINGVASGIYGLISFTYPAEMVGASYRGYVNFVTSVTFALGISTLPILAYFVRDWRMLSLYCALPGLFGIYYYYCVIESPRWLYSQNRIAEAEHVMNVMYQANQPLSLPPPPPLTLSMTSITASLRYVFVYVCEYVHVSTFSRVPTSLPASPSSENLRTLLQEAVMEHAAVNNKNKNITNHTNNKNSNSFSNGSNSANNFSNNNNNNFSNNNNNFSSTDDDEELNRNDIEIQESLLYKENTSIAGLFDGIVHTYEEIHNQNKTHHDVSNINSNININNKNINNNNVINNNNSILYKKYKSRSHRIVLRHNKGHGKFSNGKVAVSSTKWSDVISSKFLLKITAVNMLAWLTANTLYYGLTLKMGDLNGNRYVNVMFSGLVEIPACLFTLYFMDTYGRKTTFTYTLLSCGFLTLLMGLTSPGTSYVSVGLALMSKTIVAMGVCVCWMHATEMYPTNIRNKAMSLCSMCGRFGGVVAPMILSLGRVTEGRDFIIFGLASIISGIFSLHLPETLHRKLPETIDDLTFMVN